MSSWSAPEAGILPPCWRPVARKWWRWRRKPASTASGPYEAILIEGAVPAIPEIFAAQLTPGGRLVTILADHDEPAGLGRGVVAEATGNGFAMVKLFDCTAR